MKPLVIYHGGECADGFGAAFAAWLKLGDEAEYLSMNYGEVKTPTDFDMKVSLAARGNDVYILDFSFPREIMDALFQHAARVVWLDHHASVFKDWGVPLDDVADELILGLVQPNDHTVILDNNKSGALLAWEYFHPTTKVPKLIQHIDDRDRWQFKLEGSKEFHAALASYQPWTFEMWRGIFLCGLFEKETWRVPEEFYMEGAAILRAHNQNVQAALKQARACEIHWGEIFATADNTPAVRKGFEVGGYSKGFAETRTGLAANAPSFLASDLGHELANKSGTFGLVWSMAGDGQVHCSLRSNGEYGVSAIAKAFGGGGHRNAAGFSTDINTLLGWLKLVS